MNLFADATSQSLDSIERLMEAELPAQGSLEEAAQWLSRTLHETFAAGSVLVRTFATVPLERLPGDARDFAASIAAQGGLPPLRPGTMALALLGTCGVEPGWKERTLSRGHLAIPLASNTFVESIPMIARLLKELGATLTWADDLDTAIVTQSFGTLAGVFYVEDAESERDGLGRRVIPASDFVSRYGVKTVFGFGGSYPVRRTFIVTVVFTRERMGRQVAERFMRLTSAFKAVTMRTVLDGRLFAGPREIPGGST